MSRNSQCCNEMEKSLTLKNDEILGFSIPQVPFDNLCGMESMLSEVKVEDNCVVVSSKGVLIEK